MSKKKPNKWKDVNTYLIIALVAVVALGLYFTLSIPTGPGPVEEVKVEQKVVSVQLLGSDCDECFNINVAIDFIKSQENIEIKELTNTTLEDSKEQAEKYNITKLPAVIVTGDIEGLTIPNFNKKDNALIFSQAPPPYYDIETGEIKGIVTLTQIIDSSCTECFDMNIIVSQLEQVGVEIKSKETIESTSSEGKEIIAKYKIDKIPTLIFNKEALEYDLIQDVWNEVGTQEEDGTLVLRFVNPPYVNTSTGKTEGLVKLTLLVDESCETCYDAEIFKELFSGSFNMAFSSEETLDISSTKGKFTIKKHNITQVPTAILSKEAGAYPSIAQAWGQVGTIAKDGSFVFTNIGLLDSYFKQSKGTSLIYKDLSTGKIIDTGAKSETTEEASEEETTEIATESETNSTA